MGSDLRILTYKDKSSSLLDAYVSIDRKLLYKTMRTYTLRGCIGTRFAPETICDILFYMGLRFLTICNSNTYFIIDFCDIGTFTSSSTMTTLDNVVLRGIDRREKLNGIISDGSFVALDTRRLSRDGASSSTRAVGYGFG